MLVEVYGDTAPIDKSCREWFRRFKDGVEEKLRSGQPKKFEDKELGHYSKKIRVKRKRSLQNHWG